MTENPPQPGSPEGGTPPPPDPQNPYGAAPGQPPTPPANPYSSMPPPPAEPYAGNPPAAGQAPYGATPSSPPPPPPPPPPSGSYGADPYPAAPYPATPGGAPVTGVRPAGLLERFVARFIDGILLGIISVIFTAITDSVIGGVLGGIIYVAYFAFLESSRGQTFGKQIMKLRVLGPTGANPTMDQALRRNAWAALSIIATVPLIGWIAGLVELVAVIMIAVTISQDSVSRMGWHDKFANATHVVKEG